MWCCIVFYKWFGPLRNKICQLFYSIVYKISAGESQQYCQLETFEPRCWKNEVIVIEKAVYGRHKIGKCISEKEAARNQESDFFGCFADVHDIVNSKCSGRKQCTWCWSRKNKDMSVRTANVPGGQLQMSWRQVIFFILFVTLFEKYISSTYALPVFQFWIFSLDLRYWVIG